MWWSIAASTFPPPLCMRGCAGPTLPSVWLPFIEPWKCSMSWGSSVGCTGEASHAVTPSRHQSTTITWYAPSVGRSPISPAVTWKYCNKGSLGRPGLRSRGICSSFWGIVGIARREHKIGSPQSPQYEQAFETTERGYLRDIDKMLSIWQLISAY